MAFYPLIQAGATTFSTHFFALPFWNLLSPPPIHVLEQVVADVACTFHHASLASSFCI